MVKLTELINLFYYIFPIFKDVFPARPASNFNSGYGHKLEHNGMQPQFGNKKPVSFIKEICSEIGETMANMQKQLMEIKEEKGELNKEFRDLKREINGKTLEINKTKKNNLKWAKRTINYKDILMALKLLIKFGFILN